MARGGGSVRGRGGPSQIYQPGRGGGQGGRGRGGGGPQRGGLNAAAQPYSPPGQAGVKRAREEGSIGGPQGNGSKRPRGGGQTS